MQLKPLTLAILAATGLSACGGGSSEAGNTLSGSRSVATAAYLACVDINSNWQCDDGDINRNVTGSGATGLTPSADQYTLLEQHNQDNRRTLLLVSAQGDDTVTGATTLRSMLTAANATEAAIELAEASLDNAALEQGYARTMTTHPVALAALEAYSLAAAAQGTTTPVLADYNPAIGAVGTLATWKSDEGSSTLRQLSARHSQVLNNSETNRLYLFDAADTTPESTEIDVIPLDLLLLAQLPAPMATLLRQGLALLHDTLDLVIDTASAATAFTGTPTTGSPIVLEPGQGIAAAQIINGGNEAIIVMNMLNGVYNATTCVNATAGNEGLFRVSLADDASYRMLENATGCVHSGFSLLASDAAGSRVAAWDGSNQKLWLLDGSTLETTAVMDLRLDASTPPQALAMTPGGRYLAVAAIGHAILIDMDAGRIVTHLTGNWGNVTQAAFASGARRLLIASEQTVFSVQLSDSLDPVSRSEQLIAGTTETLRSLTVSADGDSYVVSSDRTVYWNSSSGVALAQAALPAGLDVQQTVLADRHLVVMARGTQDQEFKLLRLTLDLPVAPAAAD